MARDLSLNDTLEVRHFVTMGMSPRRAVKFCDILNEVNPVGIDAPMLAGFIQRFVRSQQEPLRQMCVTLRVERDSLQKQLEDAIRTRPVPELFGIPD